MYSTVRPWLFKMDAEKAHDLALSALNFVPGFCFPEPGKNSMDALGMNFYHPVGLAAGLDKNGEYLDALAKIGFSFIEVGTVTPKPQVGNPKPRLFRVPETQAIVNRMGFNNLGVEALVANIKKSSYQGILGINIGKNKDTLLGKSLDDYLFCMRAVYDYASYITVNISSPNTPDLRLLQTGLYFTHLLAGIKAEQRRLADYHQKHVPIVIKISPDESEESLKEMAETMLAHGIEGIIATNTSSRRGFFVDLPPAMKQGGLSGKPLDALSTACLALLKRYVGDDITLIGAGGIDDLASAQEKIDAGASLIQIYSGLIYRGPELVSRLATGLNLEKKEEELEEEEEDQEHDVSH
jgi:dihydroorotate dehydrogenase